MNYTTIYNSIIDRSKCRSLDGYIEKHHIIPRCMGGGDDSDNIANLTAREHYVCHLLLVKMYPSNRKLVFAANMMCTVSTNTKARSGNRLYEWLRIKLSRRLSQSQRGANNSQYGRVWINDGNISKRKMRDDPLESGWRLGKVKNLPIKLCKMCGCAICDQPHICIKRQMINTMIKYFGFDRSLIGSRQIYTEYFRIVELIRSEYHDRMLSTIDIVAKYNISSTQRLGSIFKSVGVPKRTPTEALKSFRNKQS